MFRYALFCSVFLFMGCATTDVQRSVSRLERSLNDLRAFQAEQTETINSLDSQVRQLSGRVEELEFSQNKRLGSDLSALKEDLSSLRRRVPPPAVVPIEALESDESWAATLSAEPAQLMTDALGSIRDGKFSDALPLLRNAAEQLAGSDKVSVPLFWQGVAYDGLGEDKEALRSYYQVVSRTPKSPRASMSLLRQAAVLSRLGDKKAAKDSLKKLIEDYPRSQEAATAKERLKG
jgi:TolA-binding protein